MILVTRDVDRASQTITLRLKAEAPTVAGPNGEACHEVDAAIGHEPKQMLRNLGFVHVGCRVEPWPMDKHIELWAEPLEATDG